MQNNLRAIEGLVRAEPLNYNFSILSDRLKNAKASVSDYDSLPIKGNETGDYRLVTGGSRSGEMFWWDGNGWKELGNKTHADNVMYGSENVMTALDSLFSAHITEKGSNDNGSYVKWSNGFALA